MKRDLKPIMIAVCLLGWTLGAWAEDPGYFLSWQQKKDLVAHGRIRDAAGAWYDIWICPGYVPPAHYARQSFRRAGSNFHEYIEANKYQASRAGSRACFDWALQECGLGFTVRGIPRAWGRHFRVASQRTQKRVFGWWLAYPWATLESSVETAFRGALGTLGTAGGLASGLAVVPAYHALDSAVAGTWNLGVNTLLLPTVAMSWNTLVSPPLALIGQKPSESRVDGFWVTVVRPDQVPVTRRLTADEARLFGQWGVLLLKETPAFAQQRAALDRRTAEEVDRHHRAIAALWAEQRRQRDALQQAEAAQVQRAAAAQGLAPIGLAQQGALSAQGEADVRRYLEGLNLPPAEIARAVDLLRTYQHRPVVPAVVRPKTDPLRRGVEVLGESAAESFK